MNCGIIIAPIYSDITTLQESHMDMNHVIHTSTLTKTNKKDTISRKWIKDTSTENLTFKCKILTHLAYITNGKISCSVLQHFTGWKCVSRYLVLFYDVILPIDSLTLEGVTSFFHVINVRNTCKRLRYSQTFGGIASVQWRKLEEFEGHNCFFIVSCVLESK